MSYFFGPCTVSYKGTSLGKTFGGAEIVLRRSEEVVEVIGCESVRNSWVSGIEGKIYKFEFEEFSVCTSLLKSSTSGTLTLANTDYTVTIQNCFIEYPDKLTLGTNKQQPFTLTFYAVSDGTTDIFDLSEVT